MKQLHLKVHSGALNVDRFVLANSTCLIQDTYSGILLKFCYFFFITNDLSLTYFEQETPSFMSPFIVNFCVLVYQRRGHFYF